MYVIRKLIFLSLLTLLVWVGVAAYNKLSDGFSLRQMTSSLPPCPEFNIEITEERKNELQKLLSQQFHYIGKGCQFYVFESEDGKHVIKFLKHKHIRPITWLKSMPLPASLCTARDEKIERRAARVRLLFSSCKLSYEKLQDETGLLFIHLNRVPALEKKIVLVDKMGLKHTVAIDDYEYVIQKSAITVHQAFSTLSEAEVSTHIQKLTNLVLSRCHKGISDSDRCFVQNVGFSKEEDKAVFTDVGSFYENPATLQPEEQAKDLKRRLGELFDWIERRHPHLLSHR